MKENVVYLAGKVSGDSGYREKFLNGENHVRLLIGDEQGKGVKVINPAEECPTHWGWWRCMAHLLPLLAGSEFVAMLPDWKESRGARIEHLTARILNKTIIYISNF